MTAINTTTANHIVLTANKNGKISASAQRMGEALSQASKAELLGAALAGNKIARDSLKGQAITLEDYLNGRLALDGGAYPGFLALMVTACGGSIPAVAKGEYRAAVDAYIAANLLKLDAAAIENGGTVTKSQSVRGGILRACKVLADTANAQREAAIAARALAAAGLAPSEATSPTEATAPSEATAPTEATATA